MYKTDDKIGQLKLSIAINVPNLPPISCKDYRLIVMDAPWQYQLRETDATHRGRCPYPAMTNEQILNLPIGSIAHQDSYLLLWVTNNHLPLGFSCLNYWGFEYKSIFTWIKTTKASTDNEPIANMGIGHYGRNCSEHFLVGIKGKPPSFTKLGLTGVKNVIFSPRSRHSEKPQRFWDDVAYPLAEKLEGSKIELFARSKREGWDAWGSEAMLVPLSEAEVSL
jgi:Transcriptional activator, adenine-specific DNA methyltransferase